MPTLSEHRLRYLVARVQPPDDAQRVVDEPCKVDHELSSHTAITLLAKKLAVLDLARMVGHRDLRQLMIYYNESAEDIAGRIG